jgi:hypothetical protein
MLQETVTALKNASVPHLRLLSDAPGAARNSERAEAMAVG